MKDNPHSLISINEEDCSKQAMKKELGERLRERIEDQLGMTQVAAAEALGWSPQRLNNYIKGIKMMNLIDLANTARTLNTSTDWLLGISESGPPEIEPILVKLLELEKIPTARAQVIAGAVREALQLLRTSQGEGDQLQGARMAAQLAWNLKLGPRPS